VPPALGRIAARCLRKAPAERYQSAAGLRDALNAWLAGPSRKRISRRWAVLLLGVAAAIAMLAGLALSWRSRSEAPEAIISSPAPAPPPAVETHPVTIDTADGPADVYRDGRRVGSTPYRIDAVLGTTVELQLRRPGFQSLDVRFETTERRDYTYTLEALKEH
jgi:hypothetical protein